MDILPAVKKHWGFDALRPMQAEAVDAELRRRDSLVVMPTGGGKSLCYQAPALTREGVTLVISPLIALMDDQVSALRRRGIDAESLHSHRYEHDKAVVMAAVRSGEMRLLYSSPERALRPDMIALLHSARLEAIVIDEAHCISQWGADFRPAYLRLAELRACFPGVPMHAYTASATPRTAQDIIQALYLRNADVILGDFDRPNLTLRVEVRGNLERQLLELIRFAPPGADRRRGIIYCPTRSDTCQIAECLQLFGVEAECYHAGMDPLDRLAAQRRFADGGLDVIVATIAFGMGIDVPDVRFVAHTMMPSSMETYHQEIGRAGRDGQPAECVIFYQHTDNEVWESRLSSLSSGDRAFGPLMAEDVVQSRLARLWEMERYCISDSCRRNMLLNHFGIDPDAGCTSRERERAVNAGSTSRERERAVNATICCDICASAVAEQEVLSA